MGASVEVAVGANTPWKFEIFVRCYSAAPFGASAHVISKEYFSELQEESPMLSAILRKVQLRLEDSNSQSVKYANQIDVILNLVKDLTDDNKLITEKLERIKENLKDNFRTY